MFPVAQGDENLSYLVNFMFCIAHLSFCQAVFDRFGQFLARWDLDCIHVTDHHSRPSTPNRFYTESSYEAGFEFRCTRYF